MLSFWLPKGKKMIRFLCAAFLVLGSFLFTAEEPVHKFSGKHFVASYLDCDKQAMGDVEGMLRTMDRAVQSSGATVLDKTSYVFPPNGLTAVYLLSESHASIHTYPEYGACFVDLFTCGDTCSPEEFDRILREYLQPQEVNARVFLRHADIEEIPYGLPPSLLSK